MVNKAILKDILFRYGEYLEKDDYSFLDQLEKVEFNVLIRALIEADIDPFGGLPEENVDLKSFLGDLFLGIHNEGSANLLPYYSYSAAGLTKDEQIALARITKALGADVFTTNRKLGAYEGPVFLYTFDDLRALIENGELDIWTRFLNDGAGPFKYKDFTEVTII